jgi:hypothetical protein
MFVGCRRARRRRHRPPGSAHRGRGRCGPLLKPRRHQTLEGEPGRTPDRNAAQQAQARKCACIPSRGCSRYKAQCDCDDERDDHTAPLPERKRVVLEHRGHSADRQKQYEERGRAPDGRNNVQTPLHRNTPNWANPEEHGQHATREPITEPRLTTKANERRAEDAPTPPRRRHSLTGRTHCTKGIRRLHSRSRRYFRSTTSQRHSNMHEGHVAPSSRMTHD